MQAVAAAMDMQAHRLVKDRTLLTAAGWGSLLRAVVTSGELHLLAVAMLKVTTRQHIHLQTAKFLS